LLISWQGGTSYFFRRGKGEPPKEGFILCPQKGRNSLFLRKGGAKSSLREEGGGEAISVLGKKNLSPSSGRKG